MNILTNSGLIWQKQPLRNLADEGTPGGTADPVVDPVQDQQQAPVAPEGLPDGLWDTATNGLNVAAISELHKFKTEADARAASVPTDPNGYKAELLADFKAPEGMSIEFDENDPVLGEARTVAKELGLDQASFSKLLTIHTKAQLANLAAQDAVIGEEQKKLGDKAGERIGAVESYLKANLGGDEYSALQSVATSAAAVTALEKLIAKANGGIIPADPNGGEQQPQPKSTAEVLFPSMTKKD